ncbi:MAG: hypothetical protein M3Y84_11910 [Acidobacteriota bacterium]|nr:hypothetical protein [Acidobacteriota bacterium]
MDAKQFQTSAEFGSVPSNCGFAALQCGKARPYRRMLTFEEAAPRRNIGGAAS